MMSGQRTCVARRLHGTLRGGCRTRADGFRRASAGARRRRAHGPGARQVAEVVHGAPYRFSDPARFSFAHGGKDRHPFPVPLKVYDRTISVLKSAVRKARLGHAEELAAIRRLDEQARRVERSPADLPSMCCSPMSGNDRTNTAAEAYSGMNRHRSPCGGVRMLNELRVSWQLMPYWAQPAAIEFAG